jgi:plasmid stability protein
MAIGQYHAFMDKKPQDTASRHADKYIVRLPDGMRDRIAFAAEESGRSMNAEIVARLEASLSGDGDQSALISALARLNLALGRAELEQQETQMKAILLAHWLKKAADAISERFGDSDAGALALAHDLTQQAQPFLEQQDAAEATLLLKVDQVMKAIKELRKAGPPPTPVQQEPSGIAPQEPVGPLQRKPRIKAARTRAEAANKTKPE